MDNNQSWLDRLAILAKYRKFLLRWLLLWIVIGVVASYVLPTRYRAECTFLPPTDESEGLLGAFGSSIRLSRTSDIEGAGFNVIVHSVRVKDSLDKKYNFRKRYGEEKLDRAYSQFDDRLEIVSATEEGLGMARIHAFTVRVTDKSAEDAAAMANDAVYFADRVTAELTSQRQHLTREFLEQRVSAIRESLQIAEDSLRFFSQRTGIVAPDVQIEATIKTLSGIEEQIAGTDVALHVAMTTFGASHPSVKETQARKAELEKQRDELSGKIENTVTTNLMTLKDSPKLTIQYTRLFRDMKTKEALLGFLIEQSEQAHIGELRDVTVLRVLDRAKVPESRRWPIRSLVVLLACFLGMFSGLLWIGWREWLLAVGGSEFGERLKSLAHQFTPVSLLRIFFGKE